MQSELVAFGVNAYQEHDYTTAISYLEQADRGEWIGQLYLAMSYYQVGRSDESQRVFFTIKSQCPDPEIRSKAESAFLAVRTKLRQAAKELQERTEISEEVEW